jgi:hypothetical protein
MLRASVPHRLNVSLQRRVAPAALVLGLAALSACSSGSSSQPGASPAPARASREAPSPDRRIGLKAGVYDAGMATWNMRLVSTTPSPEKFEGVTNSDLAFTGNYAIQGNYNGFQVWDISNPARPSLVTAFYCPASQSDVSVYKNLLFVSGEAGSGRLDCGDQGVRERVSHDRLRGIRIFDISDIRNPKYIANVQTCRGSHTHTVLESPRDKDNVYIYISGSAGVRPEEELPGCTTGRTSENPNTAEFRIEVIRVPLADPTKAAIVSSPRIFEDIPAPPRRTSTSPADAEATRQAIARGAFFAEVGGEQMLMPDRLIQPMLDSVVKARGGTGAATKADSAALRAALPDIISRMINPGRRGPSGPPPGPTQCHDITVYPAIGLAGGACEGYGLLLDIADPANPRRIDAVADTNFSYWHNATFSNDGSVVVFGDEWGGGGGARCRALDPKEWGGDAIFRIADRKMQFQGYYKLPVAQTDQENCVAHNGSLLPIPGRNVMVQSWYQGGVSVFDFTDPKNPVEIAYFDRGPLDANRMVGGGTWSVYWYNGVLVSSEMMRGLDILELTPSAWISQNELDAAKSVRLDYLNAQGQQQYSWAPSFTLSRAYLDQLERDNGMQYNRINGVRDQLQAAERMGGSQARAALTSLANDLDREAQTARDGNKVRMLAKSLRDLAARQ